MKILKFQLGELAANCYFLTEGDECLVIDPADDASFILEELSRRRLKLVGLLATHGHFDHVMAVGEIQTSLDIPLHIFKEDQFLIDRLEETSKHFLKHEQIVIKPTKINYFKEGNIMISGFEFEVMKTPGHTPGAACFYFKEAGVVFTGDTLFQGAIGRYDFSYCDKRELKRSLEALFKLPEETRVLPGHQEETTIAMEKKNSGIFFDFLK